MDNVFAVGLDLAKQVFQAYGADAEGNKLFNRKLRRTEVLPFLGKISPCLVGMEACSSAYHWAREISALGHEVRIIPVAYVKGFVVRDKTDAIDAEAICYAATQKRVPSIPLKSIEQQGFTILVKTRALFIRQKVKSINALRGHLAEFGLVAPAAARNVSKLETMLRQCDFIPESARKALLSIVDEIESLKLRITELEKKIESETKADESIMRLTTIPGVGPTIAAAIKAHCPDSAVFKSSRQFSSWIGLTPRSHSSGGKEATGKISRRGNASLRSLLYMAASAVMSWPTKGSPWMLKLMARRPYKVAAIAVANKIARTIWALLKYGGTYRAMTDQDAICA